MLLGGESNDRVLGAILPPAGVWVWGGGLCGAIGNKLLSRAHQALVSAASEGVSRCGSPHDRRRTGSCRELSCFTPSFKGQDGDARALLTPHLLGKRWEVSGPMPASSGLTQELRAAQRLAGLCGVSQD